jgi:hypothetical protein
MCDFVFWEYATQNVKGFPTFQQTLQLPSSGSMTLGFIFGFGEIAAGLCQHSHS